MRLKPILAFFLRKNRLFSHL